MGLPPKSYFHLTEIAERWNASIQDMACYSLDGLLEIAVMTIGTRVETGRFEVSDRGHADFIHFFFDSGNDSSIAFFYYIGTEQPPELVVPRGYMAMANHTAWRVESEEELLGWQKRLESHGVKVSQFVPHETIESIYFRDPNFYPLEITRSLRDLETIDSVDASLTIEAAMKLEEAGRWSDIEQLWRTKASLVEEYQASEPSES